MRERWENRERERERVGFVNTRNPFNDCSSQSIFEIFWKCNFYFPRKARSEKSI